MHLTWISNRVIKKTFFAHFCGGENLQEILPTMEGFASQKIGSILDLAFEADMEDVTFIFIHADPSPNPTSNNVQSILTFIFLDIYFDS